MHVPEEIIHAAGVLPITLVGDDKAAVFADKCLQPFSCHVVRADLGLALRGDTNFVDGMVFPDICDVVKLLPDIWNLHKPLPFHYTLTVVGKLASPSSRRYIAEQFLNLKSSLEGFTGRPISDRDLRQSIACYNRNREFLARLYQLRHEHPSLISGRETGSIVMASMLMPKEEHNELMKEVLTRLEQAAQPSQPGEGVRLVISGNPCEPCEGEILDLIEEVGGVVVEDDLYVGGRQFRCKVNESLDPIEGLVERYIEDVPCPTKYKQADEWADHLLGLVRDSKAEGVILLMIKYCEPQAFDYPVLKHKLDRQGIPHLVLEIAPPIPLARFRTQLQAFYEIVRDRERSS